MFGFLVASIADLENKYLPTNLEYIDPKGCGMKD